MSRLEGKAEKGMLEYRQGREVPHPGKPITRLGSLEYFWNHSPIGLGELSVIPDDFSRDEPLPSLLCGTGKVGL